MNLEIIISTFSSENITKFIGFLNRRNKRTDTKNIQLFKLLKNNRLSSKEICKKLYPNKTKDAYHALRKRLYESLIDFIASESLESENSDKVQVIKYILASRSFFQEQHYKIGFKILEKAEKTAKEYLLYPYLNEIYHIKIQFAHTQKNINLNQLIVDFKENQKAYFLEEELNIVYAKTRQVVKSIIYDGKVLNFQEVLTSILKEQNIDVSISLSFKSLYQLLTIASMSAFITKDYLQIEEFMISKYATLKNHPSKTKERFYHIQVLYMIANTMFRNKKFSQSFSFLELMMDEMLENKKKYYNRFILKHDLLYALNLNYTNQQEKAILQLENHVKKKHKDLETSLDIYLSLVVFYFQKDDYKKSYKLLSKLYHTDKWYTEKAGKEWTIKKNIIEILLLLELKYFDLFENRIYNFRRQNSTYLKSVHQEKVLTFLKFVELIYQNPKSITSKEFYVKVENSFEWIGAKREDIFIMSFYAWLKSKMNKQPIYSTTLELVSKAQQF